LLITIDRNRLPKPQRLKRIKNLDMLRIPRKRAWITFTVETMKTLKMQVEVAWIGVSLRPLYSGTRKIPPPRPSPLKKPARNPPLKISLRLRDIISFLSKSSSPKVTEGAVHTYIR
jgi:hypothetical protein